MKREVRDELLDMLPQDHPDAEASRRDIIRINCILGSHRWWARTLRPLVRSGDRILEIGAGLGSLADYLIERLPDVEVHAMDVTPRPPQLHGNVEWIRANALQFDDYSGYDIIIGNFLLHQFREEELQNLGVRMQGRARVMAFSETARRKLHLYQFWLLRLLPLNPVTIHDGKLSIRSGFRDDELPRMLGLSQPSWRVHTESTWLGLYRVLALRPQAPEVADQTRAS